MPHHIQLGLLTSKIESVRPLHQLNKEAWDEFLYHLDVRSTYAAYIQHIWTNVVIEWLALLLGIQEVLDSDIDMQTCYFE